MQRVEKVVSGSKSVVRFVAEDGREFANEHDCFAYELAIKRKRADAQVETKIELDNLPPFDGEENYEPYKYKWYRPKSKEDLELLCNAYGNQFDDSCIGQWVCVEICKDGKCWTVCLNDCIEYAKHLLNYMGYEMFIKAKEGD